MKIIIPSFFFMMAILVIWGIKIPLSFQVYEILFVGFLSGIISATITSHS